MEDRLDDDIAAEMGSHNVYFTEAETNLLIRANSRVEAESAPCFVPSKSSRM